MIIDCDECSVRGPACGECVVTVLLGLPGAGAGQADPVLELDETEQRAVATLAGAGLIPPLRLVSSCAHGEQSHTAREEIAG